MKNSIIRDPKYNIIMDPTKKHDFLFLVECINGNPNGNPDEDNMPRVDPETQCGLISNVCWKHKLRDFVAKTKKWAAPYRIYINNHGRALNDLHAEGYEAHKIKPSGAKIKREDEEKIKQWMCENYWDVRMFGGAMSTTISAGTAKGPMQVDFMTSCDPISIIPITLTRTAVTRAQDMKKSADEDGESGTGKSNEIGRKYITPYGLYAGKGNFTPSDAEITGVKPEDLELFWEAMEKALEVDHSAGRGEVNVRGIYVFSHESPTGNYPRHKLFDMIKIKKAEGVEYPRKFSDYVVEVADKMPEGVTLTVLAA